jgi:hypothetical protein
LGIPLLLLLLVAALFGVRLWLDAFLRGAEFRHFLDRKASAQLQADVRLEPLHWEGSEVYSDALEGAGYPESPYARFGAEQIRAELNLRALWSGVWRIDAIELAKVEAVLGTGTGVPGALGPALTRNEPTANPEPVGAFARWLPQKVEIGKIDVADLALSWGGGQPGASGHLQGAALTARQRSDDGAWEIVGSKGRLMQAGLPALRIDQFNLQANRRELTIRQATAQVEGGGQVEFTGAQQLSEDKNLALDTTFEQLPTDSFLPANWRARLHGDAAGTAHITGSASVPGSWQAHGHIDLHEARLETLPVLDELAIFTATARFRQANLERASADFDWRAGNLRVTNLVLESEGLIRLEGGFTVRGGQIDGQLQVGVARSAGRLLAGVGARVFNEPERDGYLWTAVRLTGSARDPHEDLTGRLVQATQQEIVDKAKQGAGTVLDTASSLLNLLRPSP